MPRTVLVVVVDDDLDILSMMEVLLAMHGFEVIPLASSLGAHATIRELQPALVLLDLEMEHREAGMRLLEELRADAATAALPAVLYTANHHYLEKNRDAIRGLGAAGGKALHSGRAARQDRDGPRSGVGSRHQKIGAHATAPRLF